MSTLMANRRSVRRSIFLVLFLLVSAALALIALMLPLIARLISPSLQVGQVADQDYRAPQAVTFTSEVLTGQRRDSAERAVSPVYTQPDPSIARDQLELLQSSLAYITNVRADAYASNRQKMDDLAALDDVHLGQETASAILALSDSRWQAVQQESIVVLEQVMRSTIRPDLVDDARSSVPTLVSLSLSEQQADIVAELAAAFVAPNSLYSESLTIAAREKARDSISPVSRTFMAGETVVQRGQVLSAADVEALQQMGLGQPQEQWQDVASAAALVALILAFMLFYLVRGDAIVQDLRSLILMGVLFLAFLLGTRLAIPGHTVIPYAFPLAAYSLCVASLFGAELALASSLPLAVMVAFGLPNALDLTIYYTMGSLFGVLALGRARRITSFFWAGAAVALSSVLVVLVYRLPLPTTDLVGLATLAGAALFNGLAAASLTVLLQFFLAQVLGLTTPLQLMELTRPDQPLLQIILREAPGTYQHSLQVANLAEQAAECIHADALLTRVGALYHDAGKALNPVYFIENQVPGFPNPHDELEPLESAAIIIRHVSDGLDLARKYRLPRRISDFISEHHGTMVTPYQYVNAVAAANGSENKVDIEQFRYPGPRPQSCETAILMLADGSEARVRAEKPKEEDELRQLIKSTIDDRVALGQLDDTDLTLHDLSMIADSFTATLRGVYHPRVKYPKLEPALVSESTAPVPTVPQAQRQVREASDNSSPEATSLEAASLEATSLDPTSPAT
jgi:putative nucleotidyltransferase with HDIG domain